MGTCENCGEFVTDRFAKAFGDNAGDVHACPECKGMTAVKRGAGADPDFERRSTPARR